MKTLGDVAQCKAGIPRRCLRRLEGVRLKLSERAARPCVMVLSLFSFYPASCFRAWRQSYSIDWHTIDGGGSSTGASLFVPP